MKLKTLSAALALSLTLPHVVANAIEIRTVQNSQGRSVFEVRFFDVNDGEFVDGSSSSWSWNPVYQDHIMGGLAYWAEILQPQGSNPPSIINIGTDDEEGNAFGGAPTASKGKTAFTVLQQNIQGMKVNPKDLAVGAHGFFGLGPSDYTDRYTLSQTPLSGKDDVFNTAIHEIAHGLGLSNSVEEPDDLPFEQLDDVLPRFEERLGSWAKLLVDDNRRPAQPGQTILCQGCDNPYDPDGFDVRRDDAYLVGPHIAQVMQGGMPGVPVKILTDGEVDNNYMSHIELRNSMMSHQSYRNYTAFMEAELAVVQDLGYKIDRAKFFGRSIYGDHLNIVNNQGFYERNAAGTAYIPGQYSTAILGLGLHIYGSHNRVRQTADLLSVGPGGTGVRIDGEGNTLIIDRGVRLYGNGTYGQGIQFAYGRNHNLIHRGDIEALGENGVGIRFDFGANALSNQVEYRGSWIRTVGGKPAKLLTELQGSLVKQADISGRVAGRDAAIYIAESAHVGQINVMDGANIQGDIISRYDQRDGKGQLRLTTLSFGKKADAQGRATLTPDANFKMAYAGNIIGGDNLTLVFDGGHTNLNGSHVVHGATVKPAATLSGAARIELSHGTALENAGTIAPGNSIGKMVVVGDYRQTSAGTLQAEFNAAGTHDVMTVSGRAALGGTLALTPEAGWYNSTWNVVTGPLIESPTIEGNFDTVKFASVSPTLSFNATAANNQSWRLAATRELDAYSRYADTNNRVAVGQAMHALAADGAPSSQRLFSILDFSATDGSVVRSMLTQASPEGYSALAAASLQRDRDIMTAARQSFGQGVGQTGDAWKGFAQVFGGEGDQKHRGTHVGYRATTYGVVAGGGRVLANNPALSAGVYVDVSEQSVHVRHPLNGKGRATAFGLGGLLKYQPEPYAGIHAHGGLRLGIEDGDMTRRIAVDGYRTTHRADWTGKSIAVEAGTGYRLQLAPTVSAGPFVNMAYAHTSRPSVDESGDQATRLNLNRQSIDALRSSLGLNAIWRHTLENGSGIDARAFVGWDHEWLDRNLVQTAQFDASSASSFNTKNAILPRNTASMGVGITWRKTESLSIGFDVNGRTGSGYKAMDGRLNMSWAF
jgi:subtilase-type serine protease